MEAPTPQHHRWVGGEGGFETLLLIEDVQRDRIADQGVDPTRVPPLDQRDGTGGRENLAAEDVWCRSHEILSGLLATQSLSTRCAATPCQCGASHTGQRQLLNE